MLSLWSKRCSEEPRLVNFLACVAKYKSHIREGGLALVPSWWWIRQLVMFFWQQKYEVITESSAGQAVPHTTCPEVTYILKVPQPTPKSPSAEDQVLKVMSLCWTLHIQIIMQPKLGEAETEMFPLCEVWVSVCDMEPNDKEHSKTVKVFIKRNKREKKSHFTTQPISMTVLSSGGKLCILPRKGQTGVSEALWQVAVLRISI